MLVFILQMVELFVFADRYMMEELTDELLNILKTERKLTT